MRRKLSIIVTLLLAVTACVGSVRPSGAAAQSAPVPDAPSAMPGEVVVRVASPYQIQEIENMYDLRLVGRAEDSATYELAITNSQPVSDLVSDLQKNPDVLYAEPDYVLHAPSNTTLNADPKCIDAHPSYVESMYVDQWAPPAIGLDAAHNLSTGAGVTIAVVDTGVQTDHSSLADHVVPGYDVIQNSTDVTDPAGGADSGHGTFIAGLIALAAPGAQIMPVRVLNPDGQGDEMDVADGIDYAVDHGANIINLSLGSYEDSAQVDLAIAYAEQHGVMVVAAAGNDNTSSPEFPATSPGVVSVAATDGSDAKASFSNYGPSVTLSAPGTDLYSTYDDGQYAFGAGTSFATALVSSVAALVWSAHPELNEAAVVRDLTATSINLDSSNPDYAGQLGAGRIDAQAAVQYGS